MPNEKVREKNVGLVLDSAIKLFGERGVERSTIRAIADEAGLSARSVMNYFETKQDIVRAALEQALSRQHVVLTGYLRSDEYLRLNGCQRLCGIAGFVLRYASGNCASVRAIYNMEAYIVSSSSFRINYYRGVDGAVLSASMGEAIRAGILDGSIKADAPCDQEALISLAYSLRCLFRYIAIGGENPEPCSSFPGADVSGTYIRLLRYTFQKT